MRTIGPLALACFLATACASQPPPVVPPPPVPPDAPDTVLVQVPSDDPRLVRCGVDDRPRSVVGWLDIERPRLAATDRAFFGDRAAPGPAAGAPMAKPMIAREPPPVTPPPPTRPPLIVSIEAPRPVPGGAMPSGLGAMRPDLSSCEDVLDAGDVGTYGLEIAISSSGAPTEVRLGERAPPSKFVRCAMERACQVRASSGDATRVVVPIVVRREHPVEPPPPPPPPPVPRAAIRVRTVSGGGNLRDAVESAASQCAPRDPTARIRVEVELRRKPLGGNGIKPGETITPVTRAIEGSDPAVVSCTMRTLLSRGLPSGSRGEIVEITWNP